MTSAFLDHVSNTLNEIRQDGLYKVEREITSPQSGRIEVNFEGDQRSDIIIADGMPPDSNMHLVFIILEFIKFGSLIAIATLILMRSGSYD